MQHFFDNGFGVRANYAYTDTKAFVDGVNVGVAGTLGGCSHQLGDYTAQGTATRNPELPQDWRGRAIIAG